MGEIDIVARDADGLAFIEVKSASSEKFGLPQERVSLSKQRQISKAALKFLKGRRLLGSKARFDVVSVFYRRTAEPEFELIKNAFDLDSSFSP